MALVSDSELDGDDTLVELDDKHARPYDRVRSER